MDLKDKIVIQIPLSELWTAKQMLPHKRVRNLKKTDITAIIKVQPIKFVFADVGRSLISVDKENCYRVWKDEVERHLIDAGMKISLEDYPDHYGYMASEWIAAGEKLVVLLEKVH